MIPRIASRPVFMATVTLLLCHCLMMQSSHAWMVVSPCYPAFSKSSNRRSQKSVQLAAREKRFFQLGFSSISSPPPSPSVKNIFLGGDGGVGGGNLAGVLQSPSSPSSIRAGTTTENCKVVEQLFATSSLPVYLFDGVCNFCNDSVHLCYDLDEEKRLRFCSLQSATGKAVLSHFGKSPDDLSSLVLITSPDTCYFQSDAVLHIVQLLTGLPVAVRSAAAVARSLVPARMRNAAYRVLSANRHVFGTTQKEDANGISGHPTGSCRVDLDPSRFVDDGLQG